MDQPDEDAREQEQMQEQEHDDEPQAEIRSARLTLWISTGAILLATAYLVLIAIGRVPLENRLGQTEVILFVALLVLNPSVISRLASLDVSSKGLSVKLGQVARRQRRLQLDIAQLKFLITHYLSDDELLHLDRLARNVESDPVVAYNVQGQFIAELRHLRSLRLIESLPGKGLSRLPEAGNLRDQVSITRDGRRFLEWWRAEAGQPTSGSGGDRGIGDARP